MAVFGRPRKRFSQNFLIDQNLAGKIVGLLGIAQSDTVFEIGPGRGVLTELIAASGAKTFAFELDRDLIGALKERLGRFTNLEIINIDFLKVVPKRYVPGKIKLIGNIPYDITSPVLNWICRRHDIIDRAVITAQRELAERISSVPGEKNWAPIAIFTGCFFDIERTFDIPPTAFHPRPKVMSSTLVLKPAGRYSVPDWDHFERVVRTAFGHRRKMLVNNLASWPGATREMIADILSRLGFPRTVRAEEVGIEEFIRLAGEMRTIKNS